MAGVQELELEGVIGFSGQPSAPREVAVRVAVPVQEVVRVVGVGVAAVGVVVVMRGGGYGKGGDGGDGGDGGGGGGLWRWRRR